MERTKIFDLVSNLGKLILNFSLGNFDCVDTSDIKTKANVALHMQNIVITLQDIRCIYQDLY